MALFLDPEPLLESGTRTSSLLAHRLRGNETDPRVVAERINKWVHDSLQKSITFGVPSAVETLRMRGRATATSTRSCLWRWRGRPGSRREWPPASPMSTESSTTTRGRKSCWSDWVAVDPTFGQFPADAAHLRFTVGGLGRQADLLRLMGTLKIDVLAGN